jgi:glycosyltransferase involved in cell wall biosynthesis
VLIREASSAVKIVVVSAHYPPNFVSGGTLVPQRTSRLLVERGYEVKTYAGWIGEQRPALEAWDDIDDLGLPVRWIVSTPWMSWSDTANYDNPAITEDFIGYLDREQPDLVHFHSLQTVGVGLIDVTADREVPIVLTMHDFWWWCSRQFLCDTDYRPCCLVVDSGVCECHAGRAWSDERRARTEAALARVSSVVAVSEIAARVMRANGVDPARLTVIENGLADPPALGRRPRTSAGELRFTFTGGDNPMKGLSVLMEATRGLIGRPGWNLTCFGCDDADIDRSRPEIVTRPAFDPTRLSEVLAETDVLVVPSVMRETYSLVTREALGAGVPVVSSDALGPEEVVVDGVNGLIVPSADPEALGDALSRLVRDPALVDRLRVGCLKPTGIPALGDQVDALERLYAEVLGRPVEVAGAATTAVAAESIRPVGAGSARPLRQVKRVLFVVGIEGAPLRYRARFPAEALESLGVHTDVRHYRHPDISRLGDQADAVVIYRVPGSIQVDHFIAGVQRRGTPVLFDVDDLIFDPKISAEIPALKLIPPSEAVLWLEGVLRYRTTMEQCDGFIGSTAMLCRQAQEVTGLPAYRFANGAGQLLAKVSDRALHRPRSPGPLRIGYLSGTNTHDHDWRYIEPAVVEVLARHDDVELWLVGLVEPSEALDPFASRIRRYPLLGWYRLPRILRDLDVNLAPLELSSRFNEAKSAIKWLEAALTETPTVASPTEPFREVIEDGVSGILAADGSAWRDALDLLLDDELVRRRIGARARREALLGYSSRLQGRRYLDILEHAAAGDSRRSTWVPVAHDEPFTVTDLEPYEVPGSLDGLDGPVEAGVLDSPRSFDPVANAESVELVEVGPQIPSLPGSTVVLRARADSELATLARILRRDGFQGAAAHGTREARRVLGEAWRSRL